MVRVEGKGGMIFPVVRAERGEWPVVTSVARGGERRMGGRLGSGNRRTEKWREGLGRYPRARTAVPRWKAGASMNWFQEKHEYPRPTRVGSRQHAYSGLWRLPREHGISSTLGAPRLSRATTSEPLLTVNSVFCPRPSAGIRFPHSHVTRRFPRPTYHNYCNQLRLKCQAPPGDCVLQVRSLGPGWSVGGRSGPNRVGFMERASAGPACARPAGPWGWRVR